LQLPNAEVELRANQYKASAASFLRSPVCSNERYTTSAQDSVANELDVGMHLVEREPQEEHQIVGA
jgi:hypothetical protein